MKKYLIIALVMFNFASCNNKKEYKSENDKKISLYDLIESLPRGLDKIVSEDISLENGFIEIKGKRLKSSGYYLEYQSFKALVLPPIIIDSLEHTKAYIEGAKDLRVWAAYQESDVVGFISLSYSSEDCAEIDCLGVKKSFQGQGIGRELITTTIEREAVKQVDYLQVKTVAEGSNKDYDRTNVFYRSLGFKKLEIFPQLWDPQNPCQILIKKIN